MHSSGIVNGDILAKHMHCIRREYSGAGTSKWSVCKICSDRQQEEISCNVLFHELHCPACNDHVPTTSCFLVARFNLCCRTDDARRDHAFHVSPE